MKRAATMNERVERMAARAEIVEHGGKVGKLHGWDMGGNGHEKKHHEGGKKHHEAGGAGLAVLHEEGDGKGIEEGGRPYAKAHFGMLPHDEKHHDEARHEQGGTGGEAVQDEPGTAGVRQVDGRVAVSA